MRMPKLLVQSGLLALLAGPAVAQTSNPSGMPESYRQVQQNALELQRRMLIAMVDSMPERFYGDKATPAQRDFAGQIEHAAGALAFISTRFLGATGAPKADSVKSHTKAGLRDFVNGTYDWAANVLKNQSASDRAKTVNLMGKEMPGWQVWDEIHQHTVWTAGQVVANFREHGMAPPGFAFF